MATLSTSCGVVHPTERYKNASFLIFVRPLRVFSLARNTCLSLLFDQPFLSRNSFSLYFHFTRRICKSFAIKLVSFSLSLSIINVSLDYLQPCQHYTVYLNWIQKRLSIYAYRFPYTYLHFFSRRECKILSFKYISMLTARVAIETKIKISTVSLMLASLSLWYALFIYIYIRTWYRVYTFVENLWKIDSEYRNWYVKISIINRLVMLD